MRLVVGVMGGCLMLDVYFRAGFGRVLRVLKARFKAPWVLLVCLDFGCVLARGWERNVRYL